MPRNNACEEKQTKCTKELTLSDNIANLLGIVG